MPSTRRPQLDDRRRLVIYSQRFSDEDASAKERSRAVDASIREARRPAAAYGWRVQRRLRARWYGLVPVRRRALSGFAASLFALVGLLGLGHWAALWWEPIALRPDVARPLRLDRVDSFGTWLGAVLLLMSAGAAFLVYQLRRYRADDYHGHYRLWRTTILICLLASLDSVTHVVGALGGLVDVLLAERDALAGADWIRLMIGVGGAAFGLRMVGELARDRLSAATMIGALGMLAVAPAVRWNLVRMDAVTSVQWVPMATLGGRALAMLAIVVYLRMLYREVRRLERGDRLADRLRKLVPRWQREKPAPSEAVAPAAPAAPARRGRTGRVPANAEPAKDAERPSRRWLPFKIGFRLGRRGAAASDESADESLAKVAAPRPKPAAEKQPAPSPKSASPKSTSPRPDPKPATAKRPAADPESADPNTPRRRRLSFGWLLKRRAADDAAPGQTSEVKKVAAAVETAADDAEAAPRKRFGFGFGRRKAAAAVDESEGSSPPAPAARSAPASPAASVRSRSPQESAAAAAERPQAPARPAAVHARTDEDDDGDDGDQGDGDGEDGVDWEGMSKSEKRRMRKLIKRQGRAA